MSSYSSDRHTHRNKIYMHVYTDIYIYLPKYIHKNTCMYIYDIYLPVYIHKYTYIYIYTCTFIYVYLYIYMNIYRCMFMHARKTCMWHVCLWCMYYKYTATCRIYARCVFVIHVARRVCLWCMFMHCINIHLYTDVCFYTQDMYYKYTDMYVPIYIFKYTYLSL